MQSIHTRRGWPLACASLPVLFLLLLGPSPAIAAVLDQSAPQPRVPIERFYAPREHPDIKPFLGPAWPRADADGAWLGVAVQDLTPDLTEALGLATEQGALVSSVAETSPAADAGMVAEDLIVALDGEPIAAAAELVRRIRACEPGSEVQLEILRGDERHTLRIELAERSAAPPLRSALRRMLHPPQLPELPELRGLPNLRLPQIRPRIRYRRHPDAPDKEDRPESLDEEIAGLRQQIEELREELALLRERLAAQ